MKTLGNFPSWQSGLLEQIAQSQTCPNSVNELGELIDRFTTNCHYQATRHISSNNTYCPEKHEHLIALRIMSICKISWKLLTL